MLKTTRWRPDTCKCVIEYTWESDVPETSRVTTFKSIKKCPEHEALTDQEAYEKAREDNKRKNRAVGKIVELTGVDIQAVNFKTLPGMVYEYETPALTHAQRGLVIAELAKTFGESVRLKNDRSSHTIRESCGEHCQSYKYRVWYARSRFAE